MNVEDQLKEFSVSAHVDRDQLTERATRRRTRRRTAGATAVVATLALGAAVLTSLPRTPQVEVTGIPADDAEIDRLAQPDPLADALGLQPLEQPVVPGDCPPVVSGSYPETVIDAQGSPDFVPTYGLGMSAVLETVLNSTEPASTDADCTPTEEAREITNRLQALSEAADALVASPQVDSSPRTAAIITDWSRCMAEEGHPFPTPNAMTQSLIDDQQQVLRADRTGNPEDALEQFRTRELAVAAANATCGGGPWIGGELIELRALRYAALEVFVDENATVIAELRDDLQGPSE